MSLKSRTAKRVSDAASGGPGLDASGVMRVSSCWASCSTGRGGGAIGICGRARTHRYKQSLRESLFIPLTSIPLTALLATELSQGNGCLRNGDRCFVGGWFLSRDGCPTKPIGSAASWCFPNLHRLVKAKLMNANDTAVTLQELPDLRRKTERISEALRQQLITHLETLRPISAPERILGKLAGGKSEVTGAERVLAEIQEKYTPFTSKPYDLSSSFDASWLPLVGSALELHQWEYIHEIQGKKVTMSSPLRWVINYRSTYNLGNVRACLAGTEQGRPELLRQFVVNALLLQSVLRLTPGLGQLFGDLRYELKTETPAELKGLPLVTITSCLSSFRPADDLISAAVAFSGVPAFIELIDLAGIQAPPDALKERIQQLLK